MDDGRRAGLRAGAEGAVPFGQARESRPRPTVPGDETDHAQLVSLHIAYHASRDPAARAELIAAYEPMARSLARRFHSRRVDSPEDVTQVALLGLVNAVDRFDPARERSFVTFAAPTIIGELKRYVRDTTWRLRVARSVQERYLAVMRALDDLTQERGRTPTVADVAQRCGLDEEQVLEALEVDQAQRSSSLDASVDDGDGLTLGDGLGEEDIGYDRFDQHALIGSLMACLSPQEQLLLRLRFVHELTQDEIGRRLGMSQMSVSRRLRRLLDRLRMAAVA